MNDILQINAELITDSFETILALNIFLIIFKSLREQDVLKAEEVAINVFKLFGYGLLAIYIYINVSNGANSTIDVLTFFTFLLAVFEASHNFLNTVGVIIASFVRSLFIK